MFLSLICICAIKEQFFFLATDAKYVVKFSLPAKMQTHR